MESVEEPRAGSPARVQNVGVSRFALARKGLGTDGRWRGRILPRRRTVINVGGTNGSQVRMSTCVGHTRVAGFMRGGSSVAATHTGSAGNACGLVGMLGWLERRLGIGRTPEGKSVCPDPGVRGHGKETRPGRNQGPTRQIGLKIAAGTVGRRLFVCWP